MNDENLKPFKPGYDERRGNRPLGAKNRSTIARKILEMRWLFPKAKLEQLKEKFPEITDSTTVEEMMTIVLADKVMREEDHNAYNSLMNSAYGAPKQEVESTVHNTSILNIDPLATTSDNGATEDSGTEKED